MNVELARSNKTKVDLKSFEERYDKALAVLSKNMAKTTVPELMMMMNYNRS